MLIYYYASWGSLQVCRRNVPFTTASICCPHSWLAQFISRHHQFFSNGHVWGLSTSSQPKPCAFPIVQPSKIQGDSEHGNTLREFQVDGKSIRALLNNHLTWYLVHGRCQNIFVEWMWFWMICTLDKLDSTFWITQPWETVCTSRSYLSAFWVSFSSVRYQIIWILEHFLMILPI